MKKINLRKLSLLLSIILILGTLFGCTPNKENVEGDKETQVQTSNYPVDIEDDFGNKVTIEKAPEKIVSLAPSHTEILFSLGLGDKVVGVTSLCDYPEEANSKEKIGDYNTVNLERIIELNPDLVLVYGSGDEDTNNRLKEVGINILAFMPESIDQVIATIEKIGLATGNTDESKKLLDEMLEKKNMIVDKVKEQEKVKVFYEIWHEPLMAAGPGSFMDELITLSSGDNIAKDAEGAYVEFDLEKLVERNPQVYLTSNDLPEKTVESISSRPGYESISAIQDGKIYLLDGNIVSRPGPRIVEALEIVAKSIHPEIFK